MATTRDKPRYQIEFTIYGSDEDDHEVTLAVRRNGKVFCVNVLPSNFIDSPATTKTFLSYLSILQSGEEEVDGVSEDDIYDWFLRPCEETFTQLAPRPVGDNISVTLEQWVYPDYVVLDLVATDDKLSARRVEVKGRPFAPPGARLEKDYFANLGKWTTVYDPATVVLSFDNPDDALFMPPSKVLIDNGQTACFFKQFDASFGVAIRTELDAYKKILSANLDSHLSLCHLFGVVRDPRRETVLGLLLTYVDSSSRTLSSVTAKKATAQTKTMWVEKLEATLKALHKAGAVWGDVKPENVLLDQGGNVWMVDFGGGYTNGWVEKDMSGTVEGDWAGMVKLKQYVLKDVSFKMPA